MRELRQGLWHWTAPHPDWTPRARYPQMVSSYAIDTKKLVEQLRVPVFVPPPDTADDLVRKFGVTREQAGSGSPDVAWLLGGDFEAHVYSAGDHPLGIEAFLGREHNDLVLYLDGVVISGDTLVDFVEINRWLPGGITREEVVERLRPLLELRIDFVLSAHGEPTDRATLERALLEK